MLGEVVGPAKKFQQGANEVLLGLGFVGVVVGREVLEEAAGGVPNCGEGGGLGAALGGGADAVGEEVLGEEVAGHGDGWFGVGGRIAWSGGWARSEGREVRGSDGEGMGRRKEREKTAWGSRGSSARDGWVIRLRGDLGMLGAAGFRVRTPE